MGQAKGVETTLLSYAGAWQAGRLAVFVFFNCMFYQLLCVQLHSCSSTQSWGSVLPSIVEKRDQNSWGCPPSLFE